MSDYEIRKAEYEAALDAVRRNPTADNTAAATAAFYALTSTPKPVKRAGFASRAGQRQAAERRAMARRRR